MVYIEDGEIILESAGVRTAAGSLTHCVDATRFPYRLPIAMINDPEKYVTKDIDLVNSMAKPEEETIEDVIFRNAKEGDKAFSFTNYMTITELKAEYIK